MKKTSAIILSLVILLSILAFGITTSAATETYHDYAMKLYSIGLFQGTDIGFELERVPTRLEGAVMFVRMLGAEEEAVSADYPHPFGDVPDWGDPYVGYLYKNELTNGISATEFGSYLNLRGLEYVTFGLRALGYSDKGATADFSWDSSISYVEQNNILTNQLCMELESTGFTRGHVSWVSYELLSAELKGKTENLLNSLVQSGSINANNAGSVFDQYNKGKRDLPYIGDPWSAVVADNGFATEEFNSRYGFIWNIYGMDYENYIQVGFADNTVKAVLSVSMGYSYEKQIEIGMNKTMVESAYGNSEITEIKKLSSDGTTIITYILNNSDKSTYKTDEGDYITYYYDLKSNTVIAFLVIEKETEETTHIKISSDINTMTESLETQVYHLTNALRVQKGKSVLAKSLAAAEIAGNHSDNMVKYDIFSHTDIWGNSVGERAIERGIPYKSLGENLAYGYRNSIDMINGWLNSQTGHRDILLGDFDYIGIGASIKNRDTIYCTQNYWR